MINDDKIVKYLKKHLTKKRYEHTKSTVKCAIELAKRFDEDANKARLAALAHDCAKWMDKELLLKNAKSYGINIDDFYLVNIELLHSYAGANIAKRKFKISDKDILDAICYHTIPVPDMSNLAKIIYIADKIEETRESKELKLIRKKKELKLDELFLLTLKTIKIWHIENDKMVHVDSLHTYNAVLKSLKNKKSK